MKKILSGFVLLSVLIALTLPTITSAVGTPTEVPNYCCLSHDIKMSTTDTVTKGSAPGEVAGSTAAGVGGCDAITVITVRSDWGLVCLMDKVYNAIDWIFWILIAVTGILVLIGAFYYAFAGGDATKSAKGKQIIVAAIASLVVAMFSRAIPSILMAILW